MFSAADALGQFQAHGEHMLFCSDHVELSLWEGKGAKAMRAFAATGAQSRAAREGKRSPPIQRSPRPTTGMLAITDKRIFIMNNQEVITRNTASRFEAVYDPDYAKVRIETLKAHNAEIQQQVNEAGIFDKMRLSKGAILPLRVITRSKVESGVFGGDSLKLETTSIGMTEEAQKWMGRTRTLVKVLSLGTQSVDDTYKLRLMRPLIAAAKASVIGTLMIPDAPQLAAVIARNSQGASVTYEPLHELIQIKCQAMSDLVKESSAITAT